MVRMRGILKVATILIMDFVIIYNLFGNISIASVITGMIALYAWLGGYLILFKEGAVSSKKLPSYESKRLEAVKTQLVEDVKIFSGVNITNLKLYLTPGNEDTNANAYGANCVSVSRGILNNTDPITLTAVLAHEISHILNYDSEFKRAILASVTLLVGAFSFMSVAVIAVIFLLFFFLNCFRSWLGVLAFRGTSRVTGSIFRLLQRAIVGLYNLILGFVSRHAEYRCDQYSCSLGYGIQLSHFLSVTESSNRRQLTMTETLYRSHPPAEKRIARIEEKINYN